MILTKKIMFFIMMGIYTTATSASPSTKTPANISPSPHQSSVKMITNYNQFKDTAREKFFIPLKKHMNDSIFNYIYTYRNKYFIEANTNFSGGSANFKSKGTGACENEKQIRGETKVKIGNNLWISDSMTLSPYMGFGVKYNSDYSGGTRTTTRHHLYDRHSTYFYLPIGLKMSNRLSNDWAMESFGEFDIFLGGRHKSKFPTPHGIVTAKQKRRYGAKGAIEFTKSLSKNKEISFGPYINYWNIKNSNVSPTRAGMNGREPHKTTVEVGLGIKYRF